MSKKPKADKVVDEIRAIFKKHDVAGGVIVADKERTSYYMELSPSWSGIALESEDAVRLKLKKDDMEKATWTAHVIFSLRDICTQWASGLFRISQMIEQNAKVEHHPFGGH